ncbi:MAG: gephyrin-like molybdotransferase Glp [Litoreibacter sp.]
MITTRDALNNLLALVEPTSIEHIALDDAAGRVLAEPMAARRAQPPFAASAMDGYAISSVKAAPGDRFKLIGEAAAGHAFQGSIGAGETVRIFTGAPVPSGGARVIIQEDVTRTGNEIKLNDALDQGLHIRPAGGDFDIGSALSAPRALSPAQVALLASMNCPKIPVYKKPVVAIIATGDELTMPGEEPRADQIIASNSFGLAAMFRTWGAEVRMLPISKDTLGSLTMAFELAQSADLVVTIGGASVGDHDIVALAAQDLGLERTFYKVAMRPGKPLMAGRLNQSVMVGLPGNPVSSMVCAEIFIQPMLDKMRGLPAGPPPRVSAQLAHDIDQNGPREHYMRAQIQTDGQVTVFGRQDSSLMTVLADANALVVRAPHAPAATRGEKVEIIHI